MVTALHKIGVRREFLQLLSANAGPRVSRNRPKIRLKRVRDARQTGDSAGVRRDIEDLGWRRFMTMKVRALLGIAVVLITMSLSGCGHYSCGTTFGNGSCT